ncbi:MAG: hypothetical protein Alpg2KO_19940 [Alphaproteobacteria bacterium]
MRPALPVIMLLTATLALTACGRKPSEVPGPADSTWPRSYPAPATSPDTGADE